MGHSKMGDKYHTHRAALLWTVQGLLVGGLALLAGHTLQRERQLSSVLLELGEMRELVISLQAREVMVERQVQRTKRQVDLQSRPQVLDYSYSPSLPPSTANLSVYERWNAGRPIGLGRHHTVSASWDGEDRERTNNEHIGQRGQGISEILVSSGPNQNPITIKILGRGNQGLTNRLIRGPSSHRHSRVA